MVRLGVTGGIGSGKSTLASMLAQRGAAWIDADQIARSVTAPGGAAIAAIRQTFGDVLIDTHGAPVIDPVWELLDFTYQHFGVFPTLLERDFNIPPLDELLPEVEQIANLQRKHTV